MCKLGVLLPVQEYPASVYSSSRIPHGKTVNTSSHLILPFLALPLEGSLTPCTLGSDHIS